MITDEINRMILQMLVAITCGRDKSCGHKIGHLVVELADFHAQALNARNGTKTEGKRYPVESYPCPWCYHWHVGRKLGEGRLRYLSMGIRSQEPSGEEDG